jgi:hypothetical protein
MLPDIAKFGVPIMTLSGSVPRALVGDLSRYLNMTKQHDESDMDVIDSIDVLGRFPPGFKITCGLFTGVGRAVVDRVSQVMSSPAQSGIHIICASKKKAVLISGALSSQGYKTELVTSDIPREKLQEIAGKWSLGEFDILVSTSSALVGNESSRCRVVFIVGLLFDLMSVVQAMGRLRPKQRTSTGRIEMFLPKLGKAKLEEYRQRDETTCILVTEKGIVEKQRLVTENTQ